MTDDSAVATTPTIPVKSNEVAEYDTFLYKLNKKAATRFLLKSQFHQSDHDDEHAPLGSKSLLKS